MAGLKSQRMLTIIVIAVLAIAGLFWFTSPIPQDPAYHDFSDARDFAGIANFWNVFSNLPFLLVGIAGLMLVYRHAEEVCVSSAETAYLVFFAGIALTALGSSYYHLAPNNQTLLWDRLPMTIGFAGLFTIIIAEYVSTAAAKRLLLPLLLVGFVSVEYWAWTEANGVGDLRPYAVVQFLPMLLIPVILLTHQPAIGEARYLWWMLGFYFIAKLFEFFDAEIFAIGGLLSGHSLKHIAAAITPGIFLYALYQRR